MITNELRMTVGSVVAALLSLLTYGANADPVAEGYELQYPATVIANPRGIAREGDHVLVLSIQGHMYAIDEFGQEQHVVYFGPGTWVGPAVNPVTGAIYASNYGYNYVAEFSGGEARRVVTMTKPAGLVVSDDGSTLYVSSYTTHMVKTIDTESYLDADCVPSFYPDGLEIWDGDLYVANRGNRRIDRVAGGCGMPMACASGFANPTGIALGNEELFIADYGNGQILRMTECDPSQPIQNIASGFIGPADVEVLNGDLYVADHDGNRVWRLANASIRGTISGLEPLVSVLCKNLSTGQEVEINLPTGVRDYDCTAAGLQASSGDDIQIFIQSPLPLMEPYLAGG